MKNLYKDIFKKVTVGQRPKQGHGFWHFDPASTVIRTLLWLLISWCTGSLAFGQNELEIAAGSVSSTAVTGPAASIPQATTLLQNTTGTTFAPFSPPVSVSVSFSNQTYTGVAGAGPGGTSGNGLMFGSVIAQPVSLNAGSSAIYTPMNTVGASTNAMYTSSPNSATGTGIDISANYSISAFLTTQPIIAANVSGRYYYGNMTVTFSRPVINPILHFVGLGGTTGNTGFSTEFESLSSVSTSSPVVINKLSGSTEFVVITSGTSYTIGNSADDIGASCGLGGACGSVRLQSTGLTSITFRVFVRGDGDAGGFASATGFSGDRWLLGASVGLPAVAISSPQNVTTTINPVISGTATPGSTVVLTGANNTTLCTTVSSTLNGAYSCTVSVPTGPNSVTATATNLNGTGAAVVASFTVVSIVTATPNSGTVSSGSGGTAVSNVAANDVINGAAATLGTGGNATVAQVGTYPTGISLNTTTGSVSVAQGTTPGSYTVVYQLCDRLTPTTCATTTVTITVTPSVTASPDAGTVSAGTGGTAVANVRANDVVNGLPATVANSSLSLVSTSSPNISLNTSTGSVSAVQATPPGTYTLVYSLCSTLGTTTCTTGIVTVTVTPSVTANPDSGTVSAGTGGTAVANVAANDVVNGVPATLGGAGNATIATVGTYPAGITLNTTIGSISVAQGTIPGSYTVVYQVCDKLTPTTCATTSVAITVTPSVIAAPNSGTVSAGTGGTAVANVAANDVVNGLPATLGGPGNATLATVGTYPTGITLNTTTGSVSVTQGTTPGSYMIAYQLCDRLTPTTCSTATVTITVTPSVIAVPDAGSVSSGTGGTAVANVAANDFVNGLPATLGASGNATLSTSGTYAAGITLNTTTGAINVALSTTPGTYTVAYQICDKLTSTCSTTTVSITVVPSSNPAPDSGTVCSGVAVNNVAANDVVNGQPVVLGTNATISSSGTYPAGITLNTTTGAINVATTAAAGSYTLVYQLCSTIGTPACATSTATVTVNPAVTATLSSASICTGTSATLTATGGNSYRFGPGNTNTSGLLIVAPTVIGATPYSVTVTSGLGCTAVATGTVTVNALPQPTISGNTSLCAGQSISLTANPTTGLTYAWSGPGGNLGSSNPLIIPNSTTANSGTYQVRVTDVNGCTALASQNVTVKPTPLAQILNTSIVCADNSPAVAIATQVTGGSPPVGYAWYRSGAVGVISTAPNPTFSNADTYSLIVTDANGCLSNTATVVVMTPDPLAVNIQTANARCFGGQGTITVTTNGGKTPYTISYYNSSGLISSAQTTNASTLTTVAGSYSIVVTDDNGCSLTQTATITQPPLLAVSLTGGGPVCAGQTTGTITSSATGGTPSYVYSWSTTTGPLAQTTPTLTGLGGGSYSVLVTDVNGCTATSSIILPTNPLPSAPTVSVTQPTCITLTGTIQVSTPASGVQYSFNNGISYQSSASLAGLQPDVYQLKVKDIGTGCESLVTSVTINPVPSPPIVSITGNTTYCAGQPISLTANPISTVSYVWSGPDGNLGTANPVVVSNPTPAQSGTYRVQVTDANGCTAVANTTVTVYALPIATLAVNSLSTCYGQPISLTAGGGTSYAFSPTVSGVTGNVASFTAGLGTALYSVTATSAQGCISLPTTVTVTVSSCLSPVPDSGTASAGTGGLAIVSVVTNDQVNLNPATLGTGGNATISPLGIYPNGISLNTTTGSISVVQGTTPGLYTVAYQLCDRLTPTTCATTTVTITVTPSVIASPDSGTVSAGTGGTAVTNVVTNDVVNGVSATLGTGGNATIAPVGSYPTGISLDTATGSVSVVQGTTPGSYTVAYQLCDRLAPTTCTSTTITITITASVTASPDAGTIGSGSGGAAVASVAANDVVNGLPATVGAGGNATLTPIGTYPTGISLNTTTGSVIVAVGTTAGSYTVAYQICDQLTPATCATATVTITVTAVAPVLTADIAATRPNTPVSGNVLTNDRDPQGLPLVTTLLTPPTSGTVTLNPDGSYSFTPATDFIGQASFCYSASNSAGLSASTCVSIDMEPDPDGGNARPIATNDNLRGFQNTAVRVVVLANDTDPNSATALNGQLTNPTLVAQPGQGTAVVNSDGSITYTPPTGFTGVTSFVYQICDQATPALCATATVNINIQPSPPAGVTLTPVGVDDFLLTQLNALQTGSVAGNDYDPQGLTLSYVAGQPNSGTVVMNPTGSYTYTPAVDYTGPASFTYQVCNTGGPCDVATVSILVQPLPPTVRLLPQVYLQGALFGVTTGSLMRDDLRAAGYLPASHPYTAFNPITPVGTMAPSVTAVTGNDAIVDWVFVELHSATSPAVIVDSRAALLQRDGDIVEVDGVSSLSFAQSILGNYYVAVRHRNHLGVMSQTALLLSATALTVDFRNINTPTYTSSGTLSYTQITADQAQVVVDQGVALWAGNALNDNASRAPRNLVIYQGTNNDVNQNYQQVINATGNVLRLPSYKLRGYQLGDINLDGQVIYQGTANDVEFIYQNIVKNHPGNSLKVPFFIIREQVP